MFNETNNKLKKLAALGNRIPLTDLLNPQFMRKNTSFETIEEMFEKSGFKVENEEDLEAIPDDEWEAFVVKNTSFDTWENMQKKAGKSLIERTLND